MTRLTRDSYALRRTAEEAAQEADDEVVLSGVEFVSRAFTDEMLYQASEQELDIEFEDVTDDVEKMFEIVRESRQHMD